MFIAKMNPSDLAWLADLVAARGKVVIVLEAGAWTDSRSPRPRRAL